MIMEMAGSTKTELSRLYRYSKLNELKYCRLLYVV